MLSYKRFIYTAEHARATAPEDCESWSAWCRQIVAMLFSKGQLNISGCHCRNIGVYQQNTNVLIKSTSWCRSNRHVSINRMTLTQKSFTGIRKMLEKRTKQLLAIALFRCCKTHSTPNPLYFDVEFTSYICIVNTFFVLYQHHFLRLSFPKFKLSRPVINHAGRGQCP